MTQLIDTHKYGKMENTFIIKSRDIMLIIRFYGFKSDSRTF